MYCENCGKEIEDQSDFCIYCGKVINKQDVDTSERYEEPLELNKPIKSGKKLFLIVVCLVVVLGIILIFANNYLINLSTNNNSKKSVVEEINNIKTVVQIMCDTDFAGSGTMIDGEGYILTNHHVVENAEDCLVTIPDQNSGEPVEIYLASPIIIDKVSEEYDIAMLKIYDVFVDEDGYVWGTYPNTFYFYQAPENCEDKSWKLGDSLKVYGYPSTSNNYNLSITEGIISNFDYGYILTSAQIDSGNSGGLAVDKDGCLIGIPSAVVSGDYQNFGVIISREIIGDFVRKAGSQIETIETESTISPQNN